MAIPGRRQCNSSTAWEGPFKKADAMPLFKPSPTLPDNERARIEFHLQQIAECIGFDRFRLPVLSVESLLYDDVSSQQAIRSLDQLKQRIGEHLRHDVDKVKVQTIPMQPEKVGGGG